LTDHQKRYSAWTDLDLDGEGKTAGSVYLPISTDRSAYRAVRVPLIVVRGGDGPSCLVMAGHHGDEYEGQIACARLAREATPETVRGTLFIMPHANWPACAAGTRTSPLDGCNLNIAFPGEEGGGPTAQLADFLVRQILPRVSLWIDLHSGGSTLAYLPMPAIHISADRGLNRRAFDALAAFGASRNLVFLIQEARSGSAAAQRLGVVYVYGEFGGSGGPVSAEGVRLAYHGTRRLLARIGAIAAATGEPAGDGPRQVLVMAGRDFEDTRRLYSFAEFDGVFEPQARLGDAVAAGGPIGLVHPIDGSIADPRPIRAATEGVVVCLRGPPLVENGDCLAHLARETSLEALLKAWT